MRAAEMRLAQFDTVEYTDEYDPINVAIPAEQWGDWGSRKGLAKFPIKV